MALETLLSTEGSSESSKNRWNYLLNGTFSNIFYCMFDTHMPEKRYSIFIRRHCGMSLLPFPVSFYLACNKS